MATVKVVDIISRAKTLLQDASSARWPVLELQLWLNDSYRDIVNMRPEANINTGTFTCTASARQTLTLGFPNALRLVEVIRNVAVTSAKNVVRLVNRQALDDQIRNWYAETPTVNIQNYMFDPRVPKEFLVYPPATALAQLEVVYSSVPTPHTLTEAELNNPATAEVIRIDDSYSGAILDYVLYRAYSKDSESQVNAQRAMAHYQAFATALGIKGQSEAASQPGAA